MAGCNILQTDAVSSLLLVNATDHLILFDCVPTSGAVTGTLTAQETGDLAALTGSVAAPVISGTLVVAEATDLATLTGSVAAPVISGTLVVAEAVDSGAFSGDVAVTASGILLTTDPVDTALIYASAAAPTSAKVYVNPRDYGWSRQLPPAAKRWHRR